MYRSKAWVLNDAFSKFQFSPQWIKEGSTEGYAIYASHYPTALSDLAAFTSSLTGTWSVAAASLPWTGAGIALALSVFGGLRLAGYSKTLALLGAYLSIAAPLLGMHMALAGYGDVWMALYAGTGLMLLLVWQQTGRAEGLWLALLLLLMSTQIKLEGWLWLMLGGLFIAAMTLHARTLLVLIITAISMTALAVGFCRSYPSRLGSSGCLGYQKQRPFRRISG